MKRQCKLCKQGAAIDRGVVHVYVAYRDIDPNRPRGPYHAECYVAVCAMYRMMGATRALALVDVPATPAAAEPVRQGNQATRIAAVMELMQESRREKNTVAAYRRLLRALQVLGFAPEEGNAVLRYLEYHDSSGKPWGWITEKLTKGKKK